METCYGKCIYEEMCSLISNQYPPHYKCMKFESKNKFIKLKYELGSKIYIIMKSSIKHKNLHDDMIAKQSCDGIIVDTSINYEYFVTEVLFDFEIYLHILKGRIKYYSDNKDEMEGVAKCLNLNQVIL